MADEMIIEDSNNILIINTAFLGDVALTAVLTQRLRNDYPELVISVLTTPTGAEVLKPINSIDHIYILDKKGSHSSIDDTIALAKKLSDYKFDIIISLHKSYRTSQIVKNIDAKVKIGYDLASNKRVYTNLNKYKFHLHEAARYQSFLYKDFVFQEIDLTIDPSEMNYIDNLLLQSNYVEGNKNIVLAPGSVWNTKKWGNDNYFELAEIIPNNYNVIFIGGSADKFELPSRSVDLMGKTSFEQSYYILQLADVLITNDSAPTHFATITNTPTVTIFGATHPMFGFSPLAEKSIIVQNEQLKCRPCRIHGEEVCPLGTLECMNSIRPKHVYEKALEIMGD
jgi:heptosyltransferase-2